MMTALGALVFGGLFGLTVLWLLLTGPYDDAAFVDEAEWDHSQRQERSNSASASAAPVGSSPWAATHSSQK